MVVVILQIKILAHNHVRFNGSGGSLRLGGATVTSIGGTFVHGTGTVEYDYAGNQSVKARNYYNLEIDGTNTSHVKSVVNSFTVDNNLTVSTNFIGTFLALSSFLLSKLFSADFKAAI